MDWLNYHHLLYFWVVAREGSIARACERLQLSQPTISTQIRKLERALGEKLFERTGRNLVLTDTGHVVFRYADEIFSLGREMVGALRGERARQPLKLVVGVPDYLPKIVTFRLLEPALNLSPPVQLVCRQGKLDQLLGDLAVHQLDIVLADAPIDPALNVKVFKHLLGRCGISIFGTPDLAERYQADFPRSLDRAPFLLPTEKTTLRRALNRWFDSHGGQPKMIAEFDDSALMKEFGHAGLGLFAAPSVMEADVQRQYGVRVLGQLDNTYEQFYAISVERRLEHPAVVAISQAARKDLFPPLENRRPVKRGA